MERWCESVAIARLRVLIMCLCQSKPDTKFLKALDRSRDSAGEPNFVSPHLIFLFEEY